MTPELIVSIFKWLVVLVLVAGGIVLIALKAISTEEFLAIMLGGVTALGVGHVVQKKVSS